MESRVDRPPRRYGFDSVAANTPSRGICPRSGWGLASAAGAAVPCFGGSAPLGSRPADGTIMQVTNGIVEAIGNTPLIRLERVSAATGCTILGKAEFMNPGQSVKDRAARQIILGAEKRGEIRPGGLVVEGTAGNTGIGLALVANARGYRTLIVIPETQSQEKKDMLRLAGADLVEVPAVPYSNPNNYQHVA